MSFYTAIRQSRANLVYLVKGTTLDLPIWQYVLVDKNKLPLFERALKNQDDMELKNYGEVLYHGYGKEPQQWVLEKISKEFGINSEAA
jgi:hypothetical protein